MAGGENGPAARAVVSLALLVFGSVELEDELKDRAPSSTAAPASPTLSDAACGSHTGRALSLLSPAAGASAAVVADDGIGAAFGRARAATGFSLDVRELCRLANLPLAQAAVFAPALAVDAAEVDRQARAQAIKVLRERGESVVDALPGETRSVGVGGVNGQIVYSGIVCDRELIQIQGKWVLQAC